MKYLISLFIVASFSLESLGLESTQTLPDGIHSPALRIGFIRNIGQRFSTVGDLHSFRDNNSIELDRNTITQILSQQDSDDVESISSNFNQLVSGINTFTTGDAGNDIHLGFLQINSEPEIDYTAPVYAIGVNDNLTLALGIPVITYRNKFSIRNFGSNLNAYDGLRGQFPEIDAGLDQLQSIDVVGSFREELAAKGYSQLRDRDDSFLGDVQLAALYNFYDDNQLRLLSRSTLILPTGRKDNPDDLTDLDIFGETAIEEKIIAEQKFAGRTSLIGLAAIRLYLPDEIEKRVPTDENDRLPGLASKENVKRQLGTQFVVGSRVNYDVSDAFAIGTGFDWTIKNTDKYSGSRNARYDLLATDTAKNSIVGQFGLSYSTVSSFQQGTSAAPFIVSYNYSDIISGRNIERQTVNELLFTMFF